MTPDEIDALLASPQAALAQALADEDQYLLNELVRLRRSRQLRQEDVAALMGTSQSAVSQFERVGNDPRLSTVRRYARALGAMVHHQVDPDGCGDASDSESLTHFRSSGVTVTPTAAAVWRPGVTRAVDWQPVPSERYVVAHSHG